MTLTKEQFVERSNKIHNNKFDYSLVEYKSVTKKVKIICKIHGIFEQQAASHLSGRGCKKCDILKKSISIKEFIERSNKIHNNKFDYSLVTYVGAHEKIKIICPIHGVFEQTSHGHLSGRGCKKCQYLKFKEDRKLSKDEFVEKANKIHNNKYDYSLIEYIDNNRTNVKIICPKHGIFEQSPDSHLRGSNCVKCVYEQLSKEKAFTKNEFVEKANKIHNNKYDYSLVEYVNSCIKIKIICPKHGIFEQIPNSHLCNVGCPKCNTSKGELKIEKWLKDKNLNYISQFKFKDCKHKQALPFDFYLPEYNICIEFDGIYHYEPRHGLKTLNEVIKRDKIKDEYCKNNNIQLIRIPYWESGQIFQILEKELMIKNNKIGT